MKYVVTYLIYKNISDKICLYFRHILQHKQDDFETYFKKLSHPREGVRISPTHIYISKIQLSTFVAKDMKA